jgi:CRISPR-associated protein Cas4
VATKGPDGQHIIAAGEVGAFTVCPMSWKLKWIDRTATQKDSSVALGQELHESWSVVFEESLLLGRWIRYLAVLISTATVVFLLLHPSEVPLSGLLEVSFQNNGLQLVVLAAITFLVIRSFLKAARKRHRATGFSVDQVALAMEGSSILPAREYISEAQGLAGKPDALVREGDDLIPVERKPLAKKLRDRYVAQLIVYMRLVEEFEGRRPSKGYLLLGEKVRRVTIENTEAKQKWVGTLISQMRGILDGEEAKATPHPAKCAKCDVRHRCAARADNP